MKPRVWYKVTRQESLEVQLMVFGGLLAQLIGFFTSSGWVLIGGIAAITGSFLTLFNTERRFRRIKMNRIEEELGINWTREEILQALEDENLDNYKAIAEDFYEEN